MNQAQADRADQAQLNYKPEASDDVLAGLLQRLGIKQVSDQPRAICSELSLGEIECISGVHYVGPRTVSRDCPERTRTRVRSRIPAEVERLAGLLKKAGYVPLNQFDRRPVGIELRKGLQLRPEIVNCDRMLAMLDECAKLPLRRNVLLHGVRGLGKTTAQLCMHFCQLALGVSSRFVRSSEIRSIAARRQSADPHAAEEAEKQLREWQAARVLVWSDIGDKDERDRNFAPTVQDLLENFGGVLLGSTNLTREQLEANASGTPNPNIGPRAVDRMYADYQGRPAIVIELSGPSQRARAAK